jgi:hypothetical protein
MGFNPNPKLIKVSDADASIPHPVHQVLADSPCRSFRGAPSRAAEKRFGTVILRRRRRRRISHRHENAQSEILRCAQNDSEGLRMTTGKGSSATASVAKDHAAQIIPEASNVFKIGCRAITLGELEELFLFALLGLDPLFHEFNDDPVGAKASLLRQAAHMPRRVCRKAHGLANDFVRSRHDTIIHQNGDARSSTPGEVASVL